MVYKDTPVYTWNRGTYDYGDKMGEEWQQLYDNTNELKVNQDAILNKKVLRLEVESYHLTTLSDRNRLSSFSLQPVGIHFDSTGSTMIVLITSGSLYQYSLTIPFDTTTASLVTGPVVLPSGGSGGVAGGSEIVWGGTKLILCSLSTGYLREYSFSTPYDITTLSYSQEYLYGAGINLRGLKWNSDGTKLVILDSTNNGTVRYSASTAYDISTLTNLGGWVLPGGITNAAGIWVTPDESRLFVGELFNGGPQIFEFHLRNPFSITAVDVVSIRSVNLSNFAGRQEGFFFAKNGEKLFLGASDESSTTHWVGDLTSNFVLIS